MCNVCGLYDSSRLSASGCMKHSWLNNLEDKAKMYKVRLKSQMMLQRYLAAHRQWKVWNHEAVHVFDLNGFVTHDGVVEPLSQTSKTHYPALMGTSCFYRNTSMQSLQQTG